MPPAFDPFKSCESFQLLMIFSIYCSQVVCSLSSVKSRLESIIKTQKGKDEID